jgi:hypothetical protein
MIFWLPLYIPFINVEAHSDIPVTKLNSPRGLQKQLIASETSKSCKMKQTLSTLVFVVALLVAATLAYPAADRNNTTEEGVVEPSTFSRVCTDARTLYTQAFPGTLPNTQLLRQTTSSNGHD